MSMQKAHSSRLAVATFLLSLLAISTPAMADDVYATIAVKTPGPPAQANDNNFWLSLGGGWYTGSDFDPAPGKPKTDAEKVGGPNLFAALNYGGPVIGRLRASVMLEYTRNTAEEIAGEMGFAMKPLQLYALAGVSRLTDVANDRHRPIVGVPLELLYYPVRGLEFGIHGNLNSKSDFAGFTVAGVFGKPRAP